MTPEELKCLRLRLGLTQDELAQKLRTTRMTVTRYEGEMRRIPGVVPAAVGRCPISSAGWPFPKRTLRTCRPPCSVTARAFV